MKQEKRTMSAEDTDFGRDGVLSLASAEGTSDLRHLTPRRKWTSIKTDKS